MSIISNALSGAIAAQAGLSATSQNISNQLTEGYSRQGVVLSSITPSSMAGLNAGSGVEVTSIRRVSDSFKTLQMWQTATLKGGYDARQPYLSQLEKVLGDDGSSLSGGIDNFFKAVNAVSTDVTSQPLRQQVIDQAQALGTEAAMLTAEGRNAGWSLDNTERHNTDCLIEAAEAIRLAGGENASLRERARQAL